MRLVGGIPEVEVNGRYRPICGHYFWDNNYGADLFCKELDRKYRSGKITAGYSGVFGVYNLGSDAIRIGKCREGDSWLRCSGGCNDNQVGGQCPSIRTGNGQCTAGARAGIKIECSSKSTHTVILSDRTFKEVGPLQFCIPVFLGIHKNPKHFFFDSCKRFLR